LIGFWDGVWLGNGFWILDFWVVNLMCIGMGDRWGGGGDLKWVVEKLGFRGYLIWEDF
jgi:hypothetical protein